MSLISRLKTKFKGIDPFFDEVRTEQIDLYQHFFKKVIDSIDVNAQTLWSQSKKYDRQQFEQNEEVMERIIAEEALTEGLSPILLQVMVNQYFFADVYQREMDNDNWVKRVMDRGDVDYFPSGRQMRALLEKVT